MAVRALLWGMAILGTLHAVARPTDVRFPVDGGTYTLSFEPGGKADRSLVETIFKVSPEARIPGIDTLLESCSPTDREYRDCASAKPGTKAFLRNAIVNVNRAVRELRAFRQVRVPKELRPAREFILRNGTFYVWLLKTRLEFLRTGQVRVLKREFEDIRPEKSCELAIDRIDAASSGDEAYRIARSDWHNCVNHVFNQRVGKYPKDVWTKFLQKYGVSEKLDVR